MRVNEAVRSVFYLLTAWLTVMLIVISGQFADPDLWGRLSMGALIVQNGHFPYYDVFSYTAPHASWIDHEWLTGLVFYQILTLLGEPAFLLLKYLVILAMFWLIFRLHRKTYRVSPLAAFYGLLLLAPIYNLGFYATTRSHLFSFFFFVLFLALMEGVRLGRYSRRLLWLLPPLGAIWANLHGGFIVGVLLIAAYGLVEAIRNRSWRAGALHWLIAVAMVLLTAVLNPYGPTYLSFLLHAWTLDRGGVAEWNPLFSSPAFWPGQLFLVAIAALLVWRCLWTWRNDRPNAFVVLLAPALNLFWIMLMALKGVRFQTFLGLAAIAYLPLLLSPDFLRGTLPGSVTAFFKAQASAFRNTLPVLLCLSSLGGLAFLGTKTDLLHLPLADEMTQGVIGTRYPLGAIDFLRKSPWRGNLAVRFGLGEFAYWMLYPRFKVSMDGRYEEVYTQRQFSRNHLFYHLKNPRLKESVAQVTHGPTDFILTEPSLPHVALLMKDPTWQMVYVDEFFMVFGRSATLKKFPAYDPKGFLVTTQIVTIGDVVTPEECRRFRNAE